MSELGTQANPRTRRDLVTNPAFNDLLLEIEEVIRAETERLTLDAREDSLAKINFQSGVVEGGKRCLGRLKNFRSGALEDFRKESA
jgi:hypothetical protein